MLPGIKIMVKRSMKSSHGPRVAYPPVLLKIQEMSECHNYPGSPSYCRIGASVSINLQKGSEKGELSWPCRLRCRNQGCHRH